MKKNKILTRPLLVLLVVAVLIVVSLFSFIFYMGRMESPCPPSLVTPEISADVLKENYDSYRIKITKAKQHSEDSIYHLDIKHLSVSIFKGNQTLMRGDLSSLLNNTSSSVSFYDMDGDGMLSTGDEFIIRGNLAVAGYALDIIDQENGVLKTIYLE